jgi:hypothetical protein
MTGHTISRSPFLPVWVWLIPLAALVLFLVALQPGLPNPIKLIAWYSILAIVGAAALTRACRVQKEFELFEPLHLVFALFLIFYPVRALFAVWLDDSWFDPTRAAIWKGLSASILGFVCFAVGYKFGPWRPAGRRRLWLDGSWNLRRADAVSLGFLLAGLAGLLGARLLGGTFLYFILLDPDIKAPGEIKAWFFYLLWLCLLIQVGALIQFGAWLSTGRRPFRTALYCILALSSTFLLARYFTVAFLILLVFGWHYQKRRIKVVQVVVLFFLVLGYLGIAGLYREWISPGNSLEEAGELAELAGQQNQLVVRYVVNNLEELSNLSEVISMTPSEFPYQFGSTFASFFLKPIPRAFLPAKPLGAAALFTQQTSPDAYYSGLVTGLGAWGEWYLNFSWLGLILGMTMTGALSSAAYKSMRATKEFGRVMLYGAFVLGLLTWVRSDFNAATTTCLYYFIPVVLALAHITTGKAVTGQVARP